MPAIDAVGMMRDDLRFLAGGPRRVPPSLAHVLEQEPGIGVLGQADTLEETRDATLDRPDNINVVVVDLLLLPDGMGVDLTRDLHRAKPDLPVLAVTIAREREVPVSV